MPGQVYRLSDGRTVQLVGTVDRADEWIEDDGTRWVRVVDYKTGSKKLDLKEVYCGLDCQMLLYLFALEKEGRTLFGKEIVPAGVLYLPARDVLVSAPRNEDALRLKEALEKELRRSGLLLAVELGESAKLYRIMELFREAGILSDWFLFCDTAFRISPPLTISEDEVRESAALIRSCLDRL